MAFYIVTTGFALAVCAFSYLVVAGLKEGDRLALDKREAEKADPFRVENWLP